MTVLLNKFLKLWDEFEIHWYLHPLSLFVPLFISFFPHLFPSFPLFSLSTNSDKDLLSQTRTLAMSFVKCASTDSEHQYNLVKDISFWYKDTFVLCYLTLVVWRYAVFLKVMSWSFGTSPFLSFIWWWLLFSTYCLVTKSFLWFYSINIYL